MNAIKYKRTERTERTLEGEGVRGSVRFFNGEINVFWNQTNHEKMTMFDRRVYRQSLRYKCVISYTASFICIPDMVEIW